MQRTMAEEDRTRSALAADRRLLAMMHIRRRHPRQQRRAARAGFSLTAIRPALSRAKAAGTQHVEQATQRRQL
jgi:hypothetical protein